MTQPTGSPIWTIDSAGAASRWVCFAGVGWVTSGVGWVATQPTGSPIWTIDSAGAASRWVCFAGVGWVTSGVGWVTTQPTGSAGAMGGAAGEWAIGWSLGSLASTVRCFRMLLDRVEGTEE